MKKSELATKTKQMIKKELSQKAKLFFLLLELQQLSGKPITLKELYEVTGIRDNKTVRLAAQELCDNGFITAQRTRDGYIYTII
ncbi:MULTISPECIES: hypothetical protein [Bacillati]|uniref:hypothetical protein n=1 Tax=Bacillati TaxID=1783272 RepID=UPI0033A66749